MKMNDEPDEVHCLECDHVYNEENPMVEKCPKCGNPDHMRTVYLQKEAQIE